MTADYHDGGVFDVVDAQAALPAYVGDAHRRWWIVVRANTGAYTKGADDAICWKCPRPWSVWPVTMRWYQAGYQDQMNLLEATLDERS